MSTGSKSPAKIIESGWKWKKNENKKHKLLQLMIILVKGIVGGNVRANFRED